MTDTADLSTCPECGKPYDAQGGPSLVSVESKGPYIDRKLCRICQLTLERNTYREQYLASQPQPEDRWEPAMTPEDKVTLTLTGINLDDLKTACMIAASHQQPAVDLGALGDSQGQRWRKLARWMTAVVNHGAADAGAALNDFSDGDS